MTTHRLFLVPGIILEMWVLIDLWTGLLGNLRQQFRFWILLLAFACLGISLIACVATMARSSFNRSTIRGPAWTAAAILISFFVYLFGNSPPFEVSRPKLDSWVRTATADNADTVKDYRPKTARIGAYDFERITQLPEQTMLFEESIPDATPYGSGLIFGNARIALDGRFQSYSVEPLGGEWFKYRASL